MDPITASTTAAGLAIGGASLAIQIFHGCVIGFEYFESAVDASRSCDAYKLRLRIEFARLYDWGDLTGLLNEATRDEYDRKTRQNRTIIVAILNELDYLLRHLRQTYLQFEDITEKDLDAIADEDHPVSAPSLRFADDGRPYPKSTELSGGTHDRRIDESDFERYQSLFAVQSEGKQTRKHKRGLNHIISWTHGAGSIMKQPKRAVWAVRGETKFSEKLSKVRELVDYLHQTLSEDQMAILVETSRDTKLGMLSLAKDVAGMKALLQAIQGSIPRSAQVGTTLDGTTLVDGRSSTTAPASEVSESSEIRFKTFLEQVIEFKILVSSTSQTVRGTTSLSDDDVRSLSKRESVDNGLRTRASIKDKSNVWIEWKAFRPTPRMNAQGRPVLAPEDRALNLVENLTALLRLEERPVEFCVPPCLGYYIDKSSKRFGFVFEPPPTAPHGVPPKSLLSMLGGEPVSLRRRLQVALQLSQCLMLFHAVDWLHKGFRSANILFFTENDRALSQAYITGFEYARRMTSDGTTTGPSADMDWAFYTHPDYLGPKRREGFKRTYDMYSLGIVLIELACWRPIHSVMGFAETQDVGDVDGEQQAVAGASREADDVGADDAAKHPSPLSKDSMSDIGNIRDRLLKGPQSVLEHVEDIMGAKYRAAVEACVEGMEAFGLQEHQNQSDPVIATLLQQEFIRVVIDTLRSIDV